MPVRARSAISMSAMTCRPDWLMVRSSSISGVEAVPREAAVAGQGRGLVHDRAADLLPQVREVVELGAQADEQRRRRLGQHLRDVRNDRERTAERGHVTRAGGAQHHAAQQPLDVVQRRQAFATRARSGVLKANSSTASSRSRTRSSSTSGRRIHARSSRPPIALERAIELVQQRAFGLALAAGDQLEVAARDGVDAQRIRRGPERQRADVLEVRLLRDLQMVEQAAGGASGGLVTAQAEAVEAVDAELLVQAALRGAHVERRGLGGGHREAERRNLRQIRRDRGRRGDEHLARTQHAQLVGQRLQARTALVLRGPELARGQVDERHAERAGGVRRRRERRITGLHRGARRRDDGHEERRHARVEIVAVDERAGGDDAHHLALDQPLRLLRVFDLLADRDPEPLVHELRDVAVGRVERHAAHRDARARPHPSNAR